MNVHVGYNTMYNMWAAGAELPKLYSSRPTFLLIHHNFVPPIYQLYSNTQHKRFNPNSYWESILLVDMLRLVHIFFACVALQPEVYTK